ncbi:MAG: response regulator [candidate division WOR-3 bacterium]
MKRIMLVEDDLTTLRSLALLFVNDYAVEEYSNAEEALKKLREDSYDLIIADLFLNEITGLDLYEMAKDKSRFIIITGYPEKELALRAKTMLGDRFIPKSSPPEVLKSKIAEILGE